MSKVFPTIDGWAGWGDGKEVQLRSDEPWDSEHPVVKARPDLFTEPEKAPAAVKPDGKVDDDTRAALVAAGWTPPADEPPQEPAQPPAKATPAKATRGKASD